MSLAVTEPLTIAQVLDKGFQLFKRSLASVWPLTLLASVLSTAPALLMALSKDNSGKLHGVPPHFFLVFILTLLATFAVYIALIRKIDDIAENRNQLSLTEALFGGIRLLPRYFGATLLFVLAMLVGFVLLLIPGFIVLVSFSFYAFFLVLEDAGAVASLMLSHRLVWGNWWRWAAIFTVAVALFAGLYAMLGLAAAAISHALAGADARLGELILLPLSRVIVTTLVTPLIYSIQLIAFRELQLRKSGDDLAARIAQAA